MNLRAVLAGCFFMLLIFSERVYIGVYDATSI